MQRLQRLKMSPCFTVNEEKGHLEEVLCKKKGIRHSSLFFPLLHKAHPPEQPQESH